MLGLPAFVVFNRPSAFSRSLTCSWQVATRLQASSTMRTKYNAKHKHCHFLRFSCSPAICRWNHLPCRQLSVACNSTCQREYWYKIKNLRMQNLPRVVLSLVGIEQPGKNRKAFPDKPVPCRLMAHSTCTLMSAGSLQFTNTEPVFRTVLRKQFYGPAWMGTKLLHLTSSDTISHTAQFELLRWSSMRLRSDCRRSSDGKFTDLPTSALRPMPNASVNIRTLSCWGTSLHYASWVININININTNKYIYICACTR